MNIDPIKSNPVNFSYRTEKEPESNRANAQESRNSEVSREASFSDLAAKLDTMPESRPDVVEKGRKLAADPSYPGPEVINKMAEFFTDNL